MLIDSKSVKEADLWKWSFENLYKTNVEGTKEIFYTIEEESIEVEGYTAVVDGYNVTNSYTPEKTSVQVTKAWIGKAEKEVTVKLLADKKDTGKTLTLNADNGWTGSFTELDVYAVGKQIEYSVEEVTMDNYNTGVTGSAAEGFVITNTLKTYAIGDYVWIDTNKDGIQDEEEKPLEGVKVELYDKDGNRIAQTATDKDGRYIFDELEAGEYQVKFTLTVEQARFYEFTKLNGGSNSALDSDADPATGWTVVIKLDDKNASLTKSYTDQTYKATQGIDPTWDAGVVVRIRVSATGSKTWGDANNQDGKRPDSITINLLADGRVIESVTTSADKGWYWSFDNLYKTNAGSTTDIVYTIEEVPVEGYTAHVNGFNITNSYTPEKTSIKVTKAWIGRVGEEVIVKLLADKVDTGKTLTLNADNGWTGSFTDLDVYAEGQAIDYSVEEVMVAGYNNEITGSVADGFLITNTQKTYAIGDYVWIDTNKNGIQDENEEPLAGVKVELYDKDGNKLGETTTDNNGRYIFDELEAGEYQVKFTLTKEQAKKYEFTKKNAGNSYADSDAEPSTGWTIVIKLDDNNSFLTKAYTSQIVKATEGIDPTWDAGVILKKIPEEPNKLPSTGAVQVTGFFYGALALLGVAFVLLRKKSEIND